MDDIRLLHDFADTRSETAFRTLVQRHLGWVHAVALRHVGGDAHLAEDVTQGVFIALARKAGSIRGTDAALAGWLFRAARFGAKGAMRMRRRRQQHESAAARLADEASARDGGAALAEAIPEVERSLERLRKLDRQALLLRFYQQRSHREVGEAMGLTEEAAKKRVARAVDRLRLILSRRGISVGEAVFGAGMLGLTGSAPQPLAGKVAAVATGAAAAGGTGASAVAAFLAKEVVKAMAWTQVKIAVVGSVGFVGLGVAVFVAVGCFTGNGDPGGRGGAGRTAATLPADGRADKRPREDGLALLQACGRLDVKEAARLIDRGADVNAQDPDGFGTPLHQVVKNGWSSDKLEASGTITRLLLQHGADPMAMDNSGSTPVEQPGSKSDVAVRLIDQRLDQMIADAKPLGTTAPPLIPPNWMAMQAANGADLRVLRLRLAQGADPNGTGSDGVPLLHQAVVFEKQELIDLLLQSGARVDEPARHTGDTALYQAVTFDKGKAAKLLLEKGADSFKRNSIGQSALGRAHEKGSQSMFDPALVAAEAADRQAQGPSVDGIQAWLRRERPSWPQGTPPRLRLDAQNHWNRKLALHASPGDVELVVDGVTYRHASDPGEPRPFNPQEWVADVVLTLDGQWKAVDGGKPLALGAGKHRALARLKATARDGKRDLSVETAERPLDVTPPA